MFFVTTYLTTSSYSLSPKAGKCAGKYAETYFSSSKFVLIMESVSWKRKTQYSLGKKKDRKGVSVDLITDTKWQSICKAKYHYAKGTNAITSYLWNILSSLTLLNINYSNLKHEPNRDAFMYWQKIIILNSMFAHAKISKISFNYGMPISLKSQCSL